MTKQANTLDAKVAKALTSDTDRGTLVALCTEADAVLTEALETFKVESGRVLDVTNAFPDEADDKARKAQLTINRLTRAIPRLKENIGFIDARNYAIEWHKRADDEAERDALATELRDTYPRSVNCSLKLVGCIKPGSNSSAAP